MLGSLVLRLQTVGSPRPVRRRQGKPRPGADAYREVQSDPEEVVQVCGIGGSDANKKGRARRKLDKARRQQLQGSKSMGRLDGIKQAVGTNGFSSPPKDGSGRFCQNPFRQLDSILEPLDYQTLIAIGYGPLQLIGD
ncbi:hypothetical protein LSTR_LSTR010283 [Laodelphax striatellus]|uniref:Uncharacterized protein n=1 Tax=Laodelphax striatellus TaxID=195883 RepID=A0A482XS42_LAOST|nr:hypothetical protein LSTR_LSTR010283 [Laodelphax striatellus]